MVAPIIYLAGNVLLRAALGGAARGAAMTAPGAATVAASGAGSLAAGAAGAAALSAPAGIVTTTTAAGVAAAAAAPAAAAAVAVAAPAAVVKAGALSAVFGGVAKGLKWAALGTGGALAVSSAATMLPGQGGEKAQSLITGGVAAVAGATAKVGGAVAEGGARAFTETLKTTVLPAMQNNALYAAVPLLALGPALRGDFLKAGSMIAIATVVIKALEQMGVKLPGMGALVGSFNGAASSAPRELLAAPSVNRAFNQVSNDDAPEIQDAPQIARGYPPPGF